MTYSAGGLIQATDYNGFASTTAAHKELPTAPASSWGACHCATRHSGRYLARRCVVGRFARTSPHGEISRRLIPGFSIS